MSKIHVTMNITPDGWSRISEDPERLGTFVREFLLNNATFEMRIQRTHLMIVAKVRPQEQIDMVAVVAKYQKRADDVARNIWAVDFHDQGAFQGPFAAE